MRPQCAKWFCVTFIWCLVEWIVRSKLLPLVFPAQHLLRGPIQWSATSNFSTNNGARTGSMVQMARTLTRHTLIYHSFFYLSHYTIPCTSFVMFKRNLLFSGFHYMRTTAVGSVCNEVTDAAIKWKTKTPISRYPVESALRRRCITRDKLLMFSSIL